MTSQEIARQTLIQLSKTQTPPTPENYQRVYNEICGAGNAISQTNIIKSFERILSLTSNDKSKASPAIEKILINLKNNDIASFEHNLYRLINLSDNRSEEHILIRTWREILIKAINYIAAPQDKSTSTTTERVQNLVKQVAQANTIDELEELNLSINKILLRAEMQADMNIRMHDSLFKVIRLLVVNIRELTTDDDWLHGQVAIIEEIISKPIDTDAISNAEFVLNELVLRQSSIKPSLLEARITLKNMMSTFLKGLEEITQNTGMFENKINNYKNEIASTEDLSQLDRILRSLAVDISSMGQKARESHKAFVEAQTKVTEAEKKINELTVKLEFISQAAHHDFLTGALNRRGLDEAIEREFNRSDKYNTPLSVAMIDIDHFKNINDKLGHTAGDVALTHLAKVVKDVLRKTDVLARYGGEEFLVLLPGSKQDDAVKVVSGVQRSLTKNFFMHERERVLITFSAGVAERNLGESFESVMPRADAALYIAKKSGRNKVVGADNN